MSNIDCIIADLRRIDLAIGEARAAGEPAIRGDRARYLPSDSFVELDDQAFDGSAEWRSFEEQMPSKIASGGLDALAWYRSFHVDPSRWGIFIPLSSLAYLARQALGGIDREARPAMAKEWPLSHEIAHFKVDVAVAQVEIMLGDPIWSEFRDRWKSGYLALEEEVANAHSLRRVRRGFASASVKALRDFMSRQPEGYRDGPSAIGDETFIEKIRSLLAVYAEIWIREHSASLSSTGFRSEVFYRLSDTFEHECPINLLDDLRSFGLPPDAVRHINAIPEVLETETFIKQFNSLSIDMQKRWHHRREELKSRVPRHPDFKKLKGKLAGVYALRLNDSYRVHLARDVDGRWRALNVGPHGAMGHD